MQAHLELIPHKAEGAIIYQRPEDGYINATAMCQAADKRWNDYSILAATRSFLAALETETGIPVSGLVVSQRGGDLRFQGTWVHPQVAINLAQWLSGEFAVKVSQWVYDWMNGKAPKSANGDLPYHLRRYVANQQNLPVGHFSILTELTQALIAPLTQALIAPLTQALIAPMEIWGYTLPESMMPDISDGRMFCAWLRKKGVDTDALPKYTHVFEDGRRVKAKAYPESLLAEWRQHFREVWLPTKAVEYFGSRDRKALEYLPKLLPTKAA
ncbi:KilA-N domain-containing protein [Pseudahrensia aquimaris]|uniref:KilA-N domain-containing protein n=1 Tax=Pseudahrensia aquimaris TaxID=744461 RepID=A0ABW3FDG0_9HYPH